MANPPALGANLLIGAVHNMALDNKGQLHKKNEGQSERTQNSCTKIIKCNNSNTMHGTVMILMGCTWSQCGLHLYQISLKSIKLFQRYKADMKLLCKKKKKKLKGQWLKNYAGQIYSYCVCTWMLFTFVPCVAEIHNAVLKLYSRHEIAMKKITKGNN